MNNTITEGVAAIRSITDPELLQKAIDYLNELGNKGWNIDVVQESRDSEFRIFVDQKEVESVEDEKGVLHFLENMIDEVERTDEQ